MNAQVGPRVCRCVLELPRRKHGRLPTAVVDPLVQVGTKECAHHVAQRTLIGRKVEVPHLLCELNATGDGIGAKVEALGDACHVTAEAQRDQPYSPVGEQLGKRREETRPNMYLAGGRK